MERSVISFETLHRERGLPAPSEGEWPLEVWYRTVYTRPIAGFEAGDAARACRQDLFPEHVIPRCLELLRDDPLAGKKYEGELLDAVRTAPVDYWDAHPEQRAALAEVIRRAEAGAG
jgi:hypothetical protein